MPILSSAGAAFIKMFCRDDALRRASALLFSRSAHQLSLAIRTNAVHRLCTLLAERTLIATDERNAIRKQCNTALLAFCSELQGHRPMLHRAMLQRPGLTFVMCD